jgi:hypothetical protein
MKVLKGIGTFAFAYAVLFVWAALLLPYDIPGLPAWHPLLGWGLIAAIGIWAWRKVKRDTPPGEAEYRRQRQSEMRRYRWQEPDSPFKF